jgi:DNA-binding transcriptional ArsR family regulator
MALFTAHPLTDDARERVAARFRALGEPMRLRILERLFDGPASVNEILDAVGGTQANVSKHLSCLYTSGLVARRKEGTRTVYSIADPALQRLCSLVCEGVQRGDQRAMAAWPDSPRAGGGRKPRS